MMNPGHSTVSYTSISSPERSWDIPDVDPYEEAALKAIEQPHADDAVPTALSSGYIADSDLEEDPDEDLEEDPEEEENADYANEPGEEDLDEEDPEEEDPKDEDPEDEESDDNGASEKEPSEGSNDTEPSEEDETAVTPPPSRLHGARISAAAARPPRDLYGFVDTTKAEASITRRHARTLHDTERIMMTAVELVNLRVSYEAQTLQRDVPVETHAPEQDVAAALLMLPSTTRRSEVPEADMPLRKRLCFATPTTGFEVGESSAAAAARPPRDLYGFVDTTKAEASITRRHARTLHDTERIMMTAVELVNLRVSYEAQTLQRDGEE
nr:hypothetical protein [Tanacetum cinerariifolium]